MFVVSLENEDVQRINAVRLVLEAEVLKLGRKKLTAPQEKKLIRMMEELESQQEGSAYKQYRLDLEFHRALWNLSGNEYLEKTLMDLMAPLFVHAATTPPEKKEHTIIISHRWMLEFVQGKLDEPAEELMLKHMRVAWSDFRRFSSFQQAAGVTDVFQSLPPRRLGRYPQMALAHRFLNIPATVLCPPVKAA